MNLINHRAAHVLKNPLGFALQVLRAFQSNQGLLLAGAVAYYALLSIVPLLILMVIALSQLVDQEVLLTTLRRALEHVAPGQGRAVIGELRAFLDHGETVGWLLLITMLLFSQAGFKVLETAISVIFLHRVAVRSRHFVVSLLLPFAYIVFISAVLFVGALLLSDLMVIGETQLTILGHGWSLSGFSRVLIYLVGVVIQILVISAIYFFMPVGRLPLRHALIGGAVAAGLWEIIRHAMAWYFGTLSQVSVVYGSLTTAIFVLFSLEVIAILLLLGAQVIAEYERIVVGDSAVDAVPMRTDSE